MSTLPPPAPPPAPPRAGPVPPQVLQSIWVRVLLVVAPSALVPWIAVDQGGDLGFLIGLLGAIGWIVIAGLLLGVLAIPQPWTTAILVGLFGTGGQIGYLVVVEASSLSRAVLTSGFGLVLATLIGASVGFLLLYAGRGVPWRAPLLIMAVVVVVVAVPSVVGAIDARQQADQEAIDSLADTGIPPYLPELPGFVATRAGASVPSASSDLSATISISYRDADADADHGYIPSSLYVTIRFPDSADSLCDALTSLPPNCTESGGVATVDGTHPELAVALDDVVLTVEPVLSTDVDLETLEGLVSELKGAPRTSYAALAELDR